VERRRVHHDVGTELRQHAPDRGVVADVHLLVREPVHAVAGERLDEIAAELPGAADDDDGQKTPPMRLSVDSMSESSVIHSML